MLCSIVGLVALGVTWFKPTAWVAESAQFTEEVKRLINPGEGEPAWKVVHCGNMCELCNFCTDQGTDSMVRSLMSVG